MDGDDAESVGADALVAAMARELERVLGFWLSQAVDEANGGFYGAIANDLVVGAEAPKGLVLNARILWTFSRAYRAQPRPEYAEMAERALAYLQDKFWDAEYGGYYLSVTPEGRPLRTTKQTYAQAFVLYGLAEHFRATGREDVRSLARDQYQVIERAWDGPHGGYLEAFTRDWRPERETRLAEGEPDAKKSMNTHLHVLEAYTNAARAFPSAELVQALRRVADIMADRVIDAATAHCHLYFERDWRATSAGMSFGHDIEASWLCAEAEEVLCDDKRIARARELALRMVEAVVRDGLAADGSVLYEADGAGGVDDDRHWWPQAEGVVGFVNAFQLTGDRAYLVRAVRTWRYIETHILDYRHGEWFWKVDREGTPDGGKNKVDFWKCPYHNSRACFEVIERLG